MLRIKEAIAVEGRYDKNTLSQVVDTLILETGGFHIFKDPEQMALLRRAAHRRGLIVLTDSDGAGFVTRNRIRGAVPQSQVKHGAPPGWGHHLKRGPRAGYEDRPRPDQGRPVRRRSHRKTGQRCPPPGAAETAGAARTHERQRPAERLKRLLQPRGGKRAAGAFVKV